MPDPALLDPNNRLLGWSTSDFSLYGGQPTVTLGASRAADPGGSFVSVPSTLPAAGNAPDASDGPALDLPVAAPVEAQPDTTASAAPTAFSIAAPAAPAAVAATPSPGVPDAVGSGSLAPIAVATPLAAQGDAIGGGPLGTASLASPVLDLALPAALLDGLGAAALNPSFVAPVLDGAIAQAGATVAAAVAAVGEAGALLDGLVAAVPVEQVTATLTPALAATAAVAGAATDTLATTVDATADLASGTVDGVSDTLTTTVDATTDLASGPVDGVGDTVATLADGVGSTTGTVTAPLADLPDGSIGGTDPVGGVATLVGMVESADLFDLSSVGTDPAAITEGGSILDALAADEAPDPLLGVTDDAAGGLLGSGDHHDDQGGLLGGL